ncbi:hypothetical protein PAAG_11330 [Paracoccidioides lutzii Pb01]|uniref:Uncharacterized protein n=1 Tax=Paracoccidioides lutzii (strain ATCC MYA-826 / Pb01) TaxID=502779 RepID=A0A0A2VM40_PARBA|nr:hypothetical protein PAAG_11330 [Paracoccidioides lutzii Pb01]KGQ01939.1 hypothetical protein PAAG_11330 [Paracoccidioides lutzii Pb01]
MVVKLPGYDVVVKFSPSVQIHEAENQQRECEVVNPDIVTIRHIHNIFHMMRVGHILFRTLFEERPSSIPQHLASVLELLKSITVNIPGSLSGGPSTGLLWGNTNGLIFNALNSWRGGTTRWLLPGQVKVQTEPGDSLVCYVF